MKLRLENPASVFSPGRGCKSPPYVLPDKNGGFITLVEYGEPECAEGCATPKPDGGCGCGGGCKPAAPKCEAGPKMPGDGQLLRYEEIAYSGYDTRRLILANWKSWVACWEFRKPGTVWRSKKVSG